MLHIMYLTSGQFSLNRSEDVYSMGDKRWGPHDSTVLWSLFVIVRLLVLVLNNLNLSYDNNKLKSPGIK